MVGIGINDNVFISKAEKNDKGTLEITFSQISADPTAAAALKAKLAENVFADWEEGGYSVDDGQGGLRMMIFPFDSKPPVNDTDGKWQPTKEVMKERMDTIRGPLYMILNYFIPDKTKMPLTVVNIFKGTGIDGTNFATKILSETVQEKVYANIVDLFIQGVTPFVGDETNPFRLKLNRQSAKKAYATLPSRYISDENPFIESMKIPLAASKLKFSKWEIANGYNSDAPVSQSTADKTSAADKAKDTQPDPFAGQ